MDDSDADSVTALDYIESQEKLERDARERMPYNFDTCTREMGPLRMALFACKTCQPEPPFERGGICYSCSISCHGDHELTELFTKRDFVCDCGTKRLGVECNLRKDGYPMEPAKNQYNHNFESLFCECNQEYDEETEECAMIQCLLGTVCGEDWFHDRCLGQVPGNQISDEVSLICWRCIETVPWLKSYAGHFSFEGFPHQAAATTKRKADEVEEVPQKRVKQEATANEAADSTHATNQPKEEEESPKTEEVAQDSSACKLDLLGAAPATEMSMILPADFREKLCQCDKCKLKYPPIFLEDIPTYEAPIDDDDVSSIHDAARAALQSLPRERALDGIAAYQRMKERLTAFLRPYAEDGKVVSEDDVKHYFEKAREEDRAAAAGTN